ncbi:MAG: alpha/beta hydrolase fold domain-containing protein, partial [Gammaproteobacteria bacterium]|nr:alpha/beta hydrolase fold domain-containing protein [Gammaproteobacteria bacterium]
LPGRLGNPEATLETDRRADPRIVAAIVLAGELAPGVDPVGANASYEECLAYCAAFEDASAVAHPQLLAAMPEFPSVTASTEVIKGVDDNDITLHIHQPVDRSGPVPCIVHTHGGGMVLMTAQDPMFTRWRNSLAEMGMVVIGVEFRNGGGRLGNHPFPAGLNDCASAAQWTYANKTRMNISSVVISGESGGGNLSIATALKANQEGWVEQIDGVYAMCPYISGAYASPPADLLSLTENDDYMLNGEMMGALVKVYDPSGEHAGNPLAWPLQAADSDLQGLPPHVISVNELDPLRDEGLAYYRRLVAAGVSAIGRTVHGTPHAGDLSFPDVVPDVYQESVRSVYGFAAAL